MEPESASLASDLPQVAQLPWYQRQLIDQLARLLRGTMKVKLSGNTLTLHGAEPGPSAGLAIHRPAAVLRRLAWRGDLGFAEAYIAGEWDSEQPALLLELFVLNLDAYSASKRRHRLAEHVASVRHCLKSQQSARQSTQRCRTLRSRQCVL